MADQLVRLAGATVPCRKVYHGGESHPTTCDCKGTRRIPVFGDEVWVPIKAYCNPLRNILGYEPCINESGDGDCQGHITGQVPTQDGWLWWRTAMRAVASEDVHSQAKFIQDWWAEWVSLTVRQGIDDPEAAFFNTLERFVGRLEGVEIGG